MPSKTIPISIAAAALIAADALAQSTADLHMARRDETGKSIR
jgi:hypothetical protein